MAINPTGESDGTLNAEKLHEGGAIISWIMSRVVKARLMRDDEYAKRWEEYTRIWRGFWSDEDKNAPSERSRLISPAIQQAIEMTVAEMEEATFGRKAWIDIDDDVDSDSKEGMVEIRDRLLEDMDFANVPQEISKIYLLGALYGTGIGKLNVTIVEDLELINNGGGVLKKGGTRPLVTLEAIRPDEFVIDPIARTIDEATFCAHEFVKPKHVILEKQASGLYHDVPLGDFVKTTEAKPDGLSKMRDDVEDAVFITEYYGLVPRILIPFEERTSEGDDEELVECIVTIANEGAVLRVMEAPFIMKDRPVIAYQHDTVPGKFWGRGVAEKGINPQKALDSELRARVDALALITAPMMGADVTRLGRNPDLRVRPGKLWLTKGRPSEILEPVRVGDLNPTTFHQTSDLERMVQVATGAMDTAIPVGQNRRNETASGMSMMQAAFIKRAKRTMGNVERNFLIPFVRKAVWRYMEFYPERYPTDFRFIISGTMGIMAKEVEQSYLTQLIGFVPPEHPAYLIILRAIFSNSSSMNRKDLTQAIEALTEPPSEEEQQMQQLMQQLQVQATFLELANKEADVKKKEAEALLAHARAVAEQVKANLAPQQLSIEAMKAAEKAAVDRLSIGVDALKSTTGGMNVGKQ